MATRPTSPPPAASAEKAQPPAWPPPELPKLASDWCIDGIAALDDETCYVLPPEPSDTLLVYLHGIVPPHKESFQKTRVESIVRDAAVAHGVVALLPRGKLGLSPAATPGWWGWPTSEEAYEKYGPALVDRILETKKRMERGLGRTFSHMYVAGSSSGAYFAAELALHGGIDADGFGAMSGGAGRVTPALAKLPPRPVYIGYGSHDSVGPSARALGEMLRHAGWPVRVAEHALGHGAHSIYLDEAFDFWREQIADTKLSGR